MSRPVLTLVLLACATFGLGLGRQAITDADEAYYAEAAREMVESGDWVTPHFNFEDRWEKPALYYWLTAATYAVTGPGEAAARLWSAVSGVGLVLLTWTFARRSPATGPHAWLAAAIVATCFGYVAMARSALPDLPLTFFITLTIAAVFNAVDAAGRDHGRWWLAAGVAAGLGFLTKGPVSLIVPLVVLAPAWWLERRRLVIRWRHVAAAATLALVIGLPWYGVMTLRHGPAYLRSFFVGDNLERFATSRFNDPRPIWFYVPIIAGGLAPWTVYACLALGGGVMSAATRRWAPGRDEWRLLLWSAMPVAFFAASVGQQPRYILPVLPPMAILLARAIGERIDHAARGGSARGLAAATWITILLFAACLAFLLRLRPLLDATSPVVYWTTAGAVVAAGGALAWVATTRAWSRLPGTAAVAAAVLLLGVQFTVLSQGRPDAVERMASLVRSHHTGHEPIGPYRVFVRSLVFYTGLRQDDLYDGARAAAFLRSPDRVLLVVREEDLASIVAAAGVETRTLGQVQYFNTANLRLGTLLAPDPATELDTVLLVTNR